MNYDRLAECPQFTVVNEYVPDLEVGSGAHESEAQLERKFISILEGQGYEYLNTLTEERDLVSNLRVQMEKLNHVALREGTFTDREWDRFYREVLANPRDHVVEKTAKFQEIRRFDFDFYDQLRGQRQGAAENINDDIVFEMDTIRQFDVNIDYILQMIEQYHGSNCKDRDLLGKINDLLGSSAQLRPKRKLIGAFVHSYNSSAGAGQLGGIRHREAVAGRQGTCRTIRDG